jgi:hypothetical protein
MQSVPQSMNPFALLMHPELVLAQVQNSERLTRLKSRVCRPLDKANGAIAADSSSNAELTDGWDRHDE